jgi:cytokinin riboside 5'-monophosphate phosphoribohydrolase
MKNEINKKRRVCIFCGSKLPNQAKYKKFSHQLAEILTNQSFDLVYGGAKVGLMGEIANSFLSFGAEVIGIIPEELKKMEVAHDQLTELHIVEGMHKRKELMYKMSDIFLIIPGGLGTMDEFFEILTWRQLGFHNKPILLFNFEGYYEHLKKFIERAHYEGFVSQEHMELVRVFNNFDDLRFMTI